jgi:lysozyme
MMRTNRPGVDLIRQFEGCKLKAYLCPAGVPTIGYGHTGRDVQMGMTITQDQAEGFLINDLRLFEQGVAGLCPTCTPNQFSALVSFAYNLGLHNLENSTLRRLHNAGQYAAAQAQFARWDKAGGRVLPGLTRRRAAEAALYGADA